MRGLQSFLLLVISILVYINSVNSIGLLLDRLHNTVSGVKCDLHGDVLGLHRNRLRGNNCGGNGLINQQGVQPQAPNQNAIHGRPDLLHLRPGHRRRPHVYIPNMLDNRPNQSQQNGGQNQNFDIPNIYQNGQGGQNVVSNNPNGLNNQPGQSEVGNNGYQQNNQQGGWNKTPQQPSAINQIQPSNQSGGGTNWNINPQQPAGTNNNQPSNQSGGGTSWNINPQQPAGNNQIEPNKQSGGGTGWNINPQQQNGNNQVQPNNQPGGSTSWNINPQQPAGTNLIQPGGATSWNINPQQPAGTNQVQPSNQSGGGTSWNINPQEPAGSNQIEPNKQSGAGTIWNINPQQPNGNYQVQPNNQAGGSTSWNIDPQQPAGSNQIEPNKQSGGGTSWNINPQQPNGNYQVQANNQAGGSTSWNSNPQQSAGTNQIQPSNPQKEGNDQQITNEQRGSFNKDNETKPDQQGGQGINGMPSMEVVMGPELTLSSDNDTKYVSESFFVICTDPTKSGVIWIGPNGIALNEYSRPVVTPLPEGGLLFFDKVRKEDEGTYSCTRGLRQRKYHLFVDESPPVLPVDARRITAVGVNCPKGYYYDKQYCRQSPQ